MVFAKLGKCEGRDNEAEEESVFHVPQQVKMKLDTFLASAKTLIRLI